MKRVDLRSEIIDEEDLYCGCGCEEISKNVYDNDTEESDER